MGPTLIFDKSFLESLSPDEAAWLDQFFRTNITPLFFVETLADLEKNARFGHSPEDVVGNLAYKTPDLHSRPNVHHLALLEGELSGQDKVNMNGSIHIGGGRYVELGGRTGAFFEASPEEEALMRWKKHEFLELERSHAKQWREGLSNIDFNEVYSRFQTRFAGYPKPKTFEGIKVMVDKVIDNPDQEQLLTTGLALVGVAPKFLKEIVLRWRTADRPSIRQFAPYFAHVLSVELFFMLGIGTDLIGRGRPSHKIDVAYLYYLPFCAVFTSNDKLHKALVPVFLRPEQSFVSGEELKSDLKKLDEYFEALPAKVKERGFYAFAPVPPHDNSFLVTRLWDKYKPSGWREIKGNPKPNSDNPVGKKLMAKIRELEEKAKAEGTAQPAKPGESDQLVIKRMVRAKVGKWTRFPPEVMNRRKNENGEWEDIPAGN